MHTTRNGFTLIELMVVIIILGIVASIAIPRFISQTTTARQNSTNSVAAALSAVSSENFAKRSANSSQGTAISNCTQIGSLMQNGLPSGYSITSQAITAGGTATCILTGTGSTTANFVGLGIS